MAWPMAVPVMCWPSSETNPSCMVRTVQQNFGADVSIGLLRDQIDATPRTIASKWVRA